MSKYNSKISKDATGKFNAMVIRIDRDGQTSVVGHYNARYFATLKAAEKSTAAYITKFCQ
jgi:hypothetical protein